MKAILLIICLLLASSVLFVPSSVLARELNAVELQADDPYRRSIGSPRTGKPQPAVSSCRRGNKYYSCLPGRQEPPSRSCGAYKRNSSCPPPN